MYSDSFVKWHEPLTASLKLYADSFLSIITLKKIINTLPSIFVPEPDLICMGGGCLIVS